MCRISNKRMTYTENPSDSKKYTEKMDKIYTRYAKAYDVFMALFPLWKKWLRCVLPYVEGERIVDISFGPAYLLTRLPTDKKLYGLDYNEEMVSRAKAKMSKRQRSVDIVRGNVEKLPYEDGFFDTVINTMAFSGYPDGELAFLQMLRILKPGGVLLLMDYDYPQNRNIFGCCLVRLIERSGNIMRNIGSLIEDAGYEYQRKFIGGFDCVQLFIVRK